jgi:hypothetical protein
MAISHADVIVGKDVAVGVVSHFRGELEEAKRTGGGGCHDGHQTVTFVLFGEEVEMIWIRAVVDKGNVKKGGR